MLREILSISNMSGWENIICYLLNASLGPVTEHTLQVSLLNFIIISFRIKDVVP